MNELNFQNKEMFSLSIAQRKAMIERVCMETLEYLRVVAKGTKGIEFLKYWGSNVSSLSKLSSSPYLNHYIYDKEDGLCVKDNWKNVLSVRYNIKEILTFVHNSVNPIPFKSPLIDSLLLNETLQDIYKEGIREKDYGGISPNSKGLNLTKKKGRKISPESKLQQIREGKITRYEAYQKKEKDSL